MNEKRVFSDSAVQKKLEELGVALVKVDMTGNEQVYKKDLARAERSNIPVNLVYPADYPARPAILLEELISPAQALEALAKIAPSNDAPTHEATSQTDSGKRVVAEK